MSETLVVSTALSTVNCGKCGGTYAINERYKEKKREDGGGWHCPYCECAWGYFGETATQRAEKAAKRAHELLAQERDRNAMQEKWLRESRDAADRRASAARGQVTKIKNRVGHGVCPCCNRTFQQLARHMAAKHPNYSESPSP